MSTAPAARVFLSSTIEGLRAERERAALVIASFPGLACVRAEDLSADPKPALSVCLQNRAER